MAGDEQAGERTEAPTQKKLGDAKKKGDIARSRELDTAVMLVSGLAGLAIFGPDVARRMLGAAARSFDMERATIFDTRALGQSLLDAILSALMLLVPHLFLMFVAVFVGPLLMSNFSLNLTAPKFDVKRMSPVKGLGRLFSAHSAGELVKSIAKVVLFGVVAVLVFRANLHEYLALGRAPLGVALGAAFELVFGMVAALTVVMAIIAVADVPWQRMQHSKKLRMTKEDIKREGKETNGNPELKSRVRSEQMRISQRTMLKDVASASVVVTNPTHYAVALRYRDGDRAPVLVAKGTGELAARIRAIAKDAGVRSFAAPPLARAVYHHTKLGQTVRQELWHAVAQVLAFVMQLERGVAAARRPDGRRERIVPPSASDLAVPRSLSESEPPP